MDLASADPNNPVGYEAAYEKINEKKNRKSNLILKIVYWEIFQLEIQQKSSSAITKDTSEPLTLAQIVWDSDGKGPRSDLL